jgi:hypothetical protein
MQPSHISLVKPDHLGFSVTVDPTIFMQRTLVCLVAGSATLSLTALASPDLSKLPPAAKQEGLTYAKDIKPILQSSCFGCHGPQRQRGGLRLDSLERVLEGSEDGKVIVPNKSEESPLVLAVARVDEKKAMPPKPRPPGKSGKGGPPPTSGSGTNTAKSGAAAAPPGGGAGGPRGPMGPPPKPLTIEQVALIRAWVDQGAK